MMKLGRGRLWLDGSGKVSIPSTIDNVKHTIIVSNDTATIETGALDPRFLAEVLIEANKTRCDPKQMLRLQQARVRIAEGAVKSAASTRMRHTAGKERKFKKFVIELMNRGVTPDKLHSLVSEAIIEAVHCT